MPLPYLRTVGEIFIAYRSSISKALFDRAARQHIPVVKGRVQTLPIVPIFNVLKDDGVSLHSHIKGLICTFVLEGAEKAFRGSVVKAIADPAHAT